jgi:hypothetical protein
MNGEEPMRDDYLWDGSGPVDPDVARLERVLRGHAHAAPRRGRSPEAAPPPGRWRHRRWQATFAVAALVAVCAIGVRGWYQQRLQWAPGQPWPMLAQQGEVRVDGRPAVAGDTLAVAGVLETGPVTSARLRAAGIGEIAVGQDSRLELVESRTGRHRVLLREGSLWARVWAPPGQFGVGVPGAQVIDLGCEFLLKTDAAGNGSLTVLSGWVQVDNGRREILVPQGARVRMQGGRAGMPYDVGASDAFVAALEAIEAREGQVGADGDEVRRLVALSRPQDAISLLALLREYPRLAEGRLFDRVAHLLPTTPAVSRADWRADHDAVLHRWWDALPYPPVKQWWSQWTDALPWRGRKMDLWLSSQRDG